MRIGLLLRDPLTGDYGRVVGFDFQNKPIGRTDGGRLFLGGKALNGRKPSLAEQYFDGDLKACNCAGCRTVLLGSCHAAAYRKATADGENVTCLPEPVAGRIKGRPYCNRCLAPARERASLEDALSDA